MRGEHEFIVGVWLDKGIETRESKVLVERYGYHEGWNSFLYHDNDVNQA